MTDGVESMYEDPPGNSAGPSHVNLPRNGVRPRHVNPQKNGMDPMHVNTPKHGEGPMCVNLSQGDAESTGADPPHDEEEMMEFDPAVTGLIWHDTSMPGLPSIKSH